ncbi:Protein ssh4 [Coemansia furcata]|uniref:Protein ssh4 n=1 Tax=Coemansia furcata TaxID=417177 RepID=A0ACC1LGV9_9FUNG|nr:Protein ssh4 [Coemansia furcata]
MASLALAARQLNVPYRANSIEINDGDESEEGELVVLLIIVVAICGALVGLGVLFLLVYVCTNIARRIRWWVFGVDEDGVSERMRSRLLPDEDSRQSYELARAFERQYPYGSIDTQLTSEQQSEIREKGVDAWEFVVNLDVNAMLQSKTEVLFMGGENCVQTNLPLPKANSVYYFEVKLVEKPADVNMWIGLATKPYPAWRMTGWNKYSTGYCVNNGSVHQNSPFKGAHIGEQLFVGDILGIGYQPRSGVVWFSRNGRRYKAIVSGMLYDLFPTISADGPCSFSANFGQRGFVFIEANVKRWGFGPVEGSMAPPPVYGANQNTILLETAAPSSEEDDDDSEADDDEADDERSDASSRQPGISADSIAIDIPEGPTSADATHNAPRSHRRRQTGSRRPPLYQKNDPIAAQLLEAGETSLEPVVSYRNKQPDLLSSPRSSSPSSSAEPVVL